ncbi:hypothetical protein [Luteimonas sp. YGD11-2]|uniref:hypothetical protein n=1 Tax=Luteimonas sp. YGD11-2 TaxID=2508168 RepID=UPI0019D71053|nr:hypothetical protein [Luteimonas sp. YGD11-2]
MVLYARMVETLVVLGALVLGLAVILLIARERLRAPGARRSRPHDDAGNSAEDRDDGR